jgi:hypothetical protein
MDIWAVTFWSVLTKRWGWLVWLIPLWVILDVLLIIFTLSFIVFVSLKFVCITFSGNLVEAWRWTKVRRSLKLRDNCFTIACLLLTLLNFFMQVAIASIYLEMACEFCARGDDMAARWDCYTCHDSKRSRRWWYTR